MSEKEPKANERIKALKVTHGEQTVPPGTLGRYLGECPGIPDLHGTVWDIEITVGKGKSKMIMLEREEFRVVEEKGGK